jgi:hypothetical protein
MKTPLLILCLVIVGAWAIARWTGGGSKGAEAPDPSLVLNRIWIDQLPSRPRDTSHLFATISRQKIGVFQSGSQYKGGYEIFNFTAAGGELRVVYPQTDEKETVKARAWKCKEQEMDYCLELSGASRGVKRYHSIDGWEIGDATRPEQLLDRAASIARAPHE